jgi:bacterial/archaeal transporter family-2 protein
LRYALMLAILAGAAIAVQVSFTSASQRTLGPAVLVSLSGLTTGAMALAALPFFRVPELTGRAVFYAVASGVLGAFIVAAIAYAADLGGVARALSLVIASQLLMSLLLDYYGVFGAGAEGLTLPRVLGVGLILAGGVLVVRF